MEIKWEQKWNKIYKEQWKVEIDILPTVKIATDIFKRNGYKKIMDLGCGKGRHSIYLAQQGFKVCATDISETAIETTKLKAEELNLKNIEFKQHDMKDIPFNNDSLDGILCVWTTGQGTLEDARKHVDEIYRVLKHSGVVVIDYVSTSDENYGKGIEIEKGTFMNNIEGEEGIAYHYSTSEELKELYSNFSYVNIKSIDYNFFDNYGVNKTIKAFVVISIK